MIGQHPELYGVPELHLLVRENLDQLMKLTKKNSSAFLTHGLRRTVSQLYAGEQTMNSAEMAQRWIFNRRHLKTSEVYIELCHKVAPLRIVDKSPSYSRIPGTLKRIQKTFPDAHYIHLVRHPRTQGRSVMNIHNARVAILTNSIDYSTNPPTIDPQYLWLRMHSKILNFLSTVPSDKQMRLRGEDVLNDPRSYFEKICKWLNLAWDESIFEAMLRPQDSPYACLGPYGANFGNDTNFLQSPAFRYKPIAPAQLEGPLSWRKDDKGFLPLVINLAQEFGYE
jgi:hypothetical protein